MGCSSDMMIRRNRNRHLSSRRRVVVVVKETLQHFHAGRQGITLGRVASRRVLTHSLIEIADVSSSIMLYLGRIVSSYLRKTEPPFDSFSLASVRSGQ
jgi:hypothetical protein